MEITVYKTLSISSAHQLFLDYESKCNQLHGHNYKLEIWVTGQLDNNGMVVDFNVLKEICMKLDHQNINSFISPSTAEKICEYLVGEILKSRELIKVRVRVWETDTAFAECKG